MIKNPIRVLIAEDSPTARTLLTALFARSNDFDVIGEAHNGAEAIEKAIALSPDLIIMDVHMPIVDGLDATKEIMRESPAPILMVSASASVSDVGLGLSATQAGALMLLEKPSSPGSPSFEDDAKQFLSMAKAMSAVKVVRRWSKAMSGSRPVPRMRVTADSGVKLIAIGTSTGGPAALHRILIDLPRDFDVPIVVVQHMARGFIDGLVKWLGGSVALKVTTPTHGEALLAGTVYIAPDDRHLGASPDGRAVLAGSAPLGGFRPSVDYLFDSFGRAYGSSLVAVILTGMGQDGVEGLGTVKERGGRVLAQDERSSVVFGMAQQAINRGLADEILPLDAISARLQTLVEPSTP
ncbi:MAG TPA: chemotaxis-specific protein-glutamate methyltransferase CheB [Gemmatimonadaceae bacterium]|jgi:two-component system chemotaxis response regulator CheB